jgi:hypothetical protein
MEHDELERLRQYWAERADDDISEALTHANDFDEGTNRIIRAEAMKRSKTCPACGLSNSLAASACDCGYRFDKKSDDPTNESVTQKAFAARSKAAGWLWGLGGYFCFAGTKELSRCVERNDIGGAAACFFFPILFFGIAGVIEFRSSRRGGIRKATQWLNFAPALLFAGIAAFFAITLTTRQRDKSELQPFFSQIVADRRAREQKYERQIEAIGFDEVLSPAFSARDVRSGFKESLRRIDAMVLTHKAFNEEQLTAIKEIERRIDTMDVSSSGKASMLRRLPQIRTIQNDNLVIVSNECSKAREIVGFLRDNARYWKVKDSTFLFDDDSLLSKYQSMTEDFNRLVDQQNRLLQEAATLRGKAEEMFQD